MYFWKNAACFIVYRKRPCPRGSSCVFSAREVTTTCPTFSSVWSFRYKKQEIWFSSSCFLSLNSPFFSCKAFLGVCDVLTAHSYQLQVWEPTCFGPLLYTQSPKLQRALLAFVCANVFVGPDSDGQSRGESSELWIFLFYINQILKRKSCEKIYISSSFNLFFCGLKGDPQLFYIQMPICVLIW